MFVAVSAGGPLWRAWPFAKIARHRLAQTVTGPRFRWPEIARSGNGTTQSMLVVAWHTVPAAFSRRTVRGVGRPVARDCSSLGAPPSPPVAIDRDLQQPFAEAQSLIGRGLFSDAMRLLQPILGDSQNKLAFLGGRYVDAKVAANRLIGTFPPAALAAYEKEFGKEANDDLQRAKPRARSTTSCGFSRPIATRPPDHARWRSPPASFSIADSSWRRPLPAVNCLS